MVADLGVRLFEECRPMRLACWIGLMLCVSSVSAEEPPTENTAVVQGQLIEGGVPLSGVVVLLFSQSEEVDFSEERTTDAMGSYRFENVPPADYRVGRLSKYKVRRTGGFTYTSTPTHTRWVIVDPGATVEVPPLPSGHTLRGRMVAPKDCPIRIAWQGCDERRLVTEYSSPEPPSSLPEVEREAWYRSNRKSPEYKAARKDATHIVPDVHPDGSFEAAYVPPGEYRLYIEVADDDDGFPSDCAGYASASFTMPDAEFTLPDIEVKFREGVGNAVSE
jgi:hypothetical protein